MSEYEITRVAFRLLLYDSARVCMLSQDLQPIDDLAVFGSVPRNCGDPVCVTASGRNLYYFRTSLKLLTMNVNKSSTLKQTGARNLQTSGENRANSSPKA